MEWTVMPRPGAALQGQPRGATARNRAIWFRVHICAQKDAQKKSYALPGLSAALQRLSVLVPAPDRLERNKARRQRPDKIRKEKDTESGLPWSQQISLSKEGETLAKLKISPSARL